LNSWREILDGAARGNGQAGWVELCRFGASPRLVSSTFAGGRPVYLATPYSRRAIDDAGRFDLDRSRAAIELAVYESARLLQEGISALSPIAISGAMIHANLERGWGLKLPDPLDGRAWARWCGPLIDASCAVVVPDLAGACRSDGVRQEVLYAISRNRRVFFYESGSASEP
jgi:hypothetical protein